MNDNPLSGRQNAARAKVILDALPIDKDSVRGMYIAIDLPTKTYAISDTPLGAHRDLVSQGFAEESITVLQI